MVVLALLGSGVVVCPFQHVRVHIADVVAERPFFVIVYVYRIEFPFLSLVGFEVLTFIMSEVEVLAP